MCRSSSNSYSKQTRTEIHLFCCEFLSSYFAILSDLLARQPEADHKLKIDCLKCLSTILALEMPKEEDDEDEGALTDEEEKKEAHEREIKIQNRLGQLKALEEAIHLFRTGDVEIVINTLKMAKNLMSGGNHQLQESMMEYFLNNPECKFFSDVRERIVFATSDLKQKRREKELSLKRSTVAAESVEYVRILRAHGHVAEMDGK